MSGHPPSTPERASVPGGVAIRADGLTRDFDGLRALDSVTVDVPRGSVFGLLGPNGAGKTTMIRLLLGLLVPTAGSATVLDLDTRRDAQGIRERTGALLEHTGLYERLSAEDNLELYGRIWKLERTERRARIRELLDGIGLWARRQERVGAWSKGMKQKLAVARALLHGPELLFLDEPTSGLDPRAAFEMRNEIGRLARSEGVTVFLTTHNLAEAELLCSSIAVIRRGRVVALGSPEELRRSRSHGELRVLGRGFSADVGRRLERVAPVESVERLEPANGDGAARPLSELRIRLAEGATAAPIVAALVHAGAEVEQVTRTEATLEEVFLALTEEEEEP